MKFYLSNNPTKKTFTGLMDFAFSASDTFQLVVRKDLGLSKKGKKLLKRLEPWLIKKKKQSEWASNILFEGKAWVYYFKATKGAKAILLNELSSLYELEQSDYPEDLSFFRKGKVIIATNSHEQFCMVKVKKPKQLQAFLAIPNIRFSH